MGHVCQSIGRSLSTSKFRVEACTQTIASRGIPEFSRCAIRQSYLMAHGASQISLTLYVACEIQADRLARTTSLYGVTDQTLKWRQG